MTDHDTPEPGTLQGHLGAFTDARKPNFVPCVRPTLLTREDLAVTLLYVQHCDRVVAAVETLLGEIDDPALAPDLRGTALHADLLTLRRVFTGWANEGDSVLHDLASTVVRNELVAALRREHHD